MAKFGVTLVLLALCAASAFGQAVNEPCETSDTLGVEDAVVVDQTQFPVLEEPVQVNLVDEELNMMPVDEQFVNAENAVEPVAEELDAVYKELDGVEPKSKETIVAGEPAFEEPDAARPVAETDAEVETSLDKAIQEEEVMNEARMFMPQQSLERAPRCGELFFIVSKRVSCEDYVPTEVAPECGGEDRIKFIGLEISKFCLKTCLYSKLSGTWLGYIDANYQYSVKCIDDKLW